MTKKALLEVSNLVREFPAGESTVQILKGIDLTIYEGELVAIVGQSGSGKSTLMNILGCLDRPTSGSYQVNGRETGKLEPDQLAELRREYFGFIFQRYHLLGDLTAEGNVEVPAVYAGATPYARKQRATALLTELGLGNKTQNRPSQLSGGQQQRVSIARALMNGGDVILADEPTGALDSHSGVEVMRILRELNAAGHTIILVTHDMQVAKNASRIIEISDGQIIADRINQPEHDTELSPNHRVFVRLQGFAQPLYDFHYNRPIASIASPWCQLSFVRSLANLAQSPVLPIALLQFGGPIYQINRLHN
jgi:macrolide transport system ATP-binding/permease protein